jgi:predicted porin
MKKPIAAAALLAAASGAFAQSSVTIFGILDFTLQRASQAGNAVTRLNGAGGNQKPRLGFRGVEDLGGGLAAGFVLDAGLNVDTGLGGPTSADNLVSTASGGLVFNRRSTVSLISRQWGELRIGRDFVPSYWNLSVFDPFGTSGAGAATNISQSALTRVATVQTAIRASNTVGYVLPQLNGFYGQAMYVVPEGPAAARHDGRYVGARLGYARGPLNVSVSHGTTGITSGDVATSNAGVSYRIGPVTAMAQYFRDSKEIVAAPSRSHGWLLGAQVTAGPGYVPVSYVRVEDNAGRSAYQAAIGYVYDLSKRTALYTTYSRLQNRGGAALTGGGVPGVANTAWRGIDVGIRHAF